MAFASIDERNADLVWPRDKSPEKAKVFAHNAVDIEASAETVWSLLIDAVAWPQWYKHCTDVSVLRGDATLGPNSKFRFKTLGLFFEPEIETFEPFRMLVWSASGPAGSHGAHGWLLERTEHGCRVVTEEAQHGWILGLNRTRGRRRLFLAHEEWLRSLKARAESR